MSGARGYTLTELVVASTLTMFVCLGGVTAAKVRVDSEKARVAVQNVMDAMRALDARSSAQPALRCALPNVLDPSLAPLPCHELVEKLREGPFVQTGALGAGVTWRMTFEPFDGDERLVKATTEFRRDGGELMKHGAIIALP